MSYYSEEELQKLGLKRIGKNALVSRKASIYGAENLSIGACVRIDDFCVLTAGSEVEIGNYVHISAYSAIFGGAGVVIEDFSGMSPRSTIFSESDDFSGESMIHPFFETRFKPRYQSSPVLLKKFVQLGCGTTVLPGCTLEEGTVTGAHSLVTKSTKCWGIYAGIPAKRLKERSKAVVALADSAIAKQPE